MPESKKTEVLSTVFRPAHEVLIEFAPPEDFHDLPLLLPPEAFDAALLGLAAKIWSGGTAFQREATAMAYGQMVQALEADGTLYAAVGLFETEAEEVSLANLLARVERARSDRPEIVAASLHETLSLEDHRDVHRVDLNCGPAVVSFHATEFGGGQVENSVAFAHIELYVPSPFGEDILIITLSTPSLAELPVYVGLMARLGDTIRFAKENTRVSVPATSEGPKGVPGQEQRMTIEDETRSVFG